MNAARIAKSRVLLAMLLAACLLLPAIPAASEPVQIIKGWGEATDPDGDCKATFDGGKLTIWIPGVYHDFWAEKDKGKVNAPRVLQDVDGDFSVQVKVTGPIKPEKGTMIPKLASGGPFQAGSLLIWQDRDNFIRLDRCCVYSTKERNIAFFYLQSFKDGKRAIDKDSNKVVNIFAERCAGQGRVIASGAEASQGLSGLQPGQWQNVAVPSAQVDNHRPSRESESWRGRGQQHHQGVYDRLRGLPIGKSALRVCARIN